MSLDFQAFENISRLSTFFGDKQILVDKAGGKLSSKGLWGRAVMLISDNSAKRARLNDQVCEAFLRAVHAKWQNDSVTSKVKVALQEGKDKGVKLSVRNVRAYVELATAEGAKIDIDKKIEPAHIEKQNVQKFFTKEFQLSADNSEMNFNEYAEQLIAGRGLQGLADDRRLSNEEIVCMELCASRGNLCNQQHVSSKGNYDDQWVKNTQQRMNAALHKPESDTEILPVVNSALNGLQKLEDYRGKVYVKQEDELTQSELEDLKGATVKHNKFASITNDGSMSADRTPGCIFVYGFEKESCRRVESFVGSRKGTFMIMPGAHITCTGYQSNNGGGYLVNFVVGMEEPET